MIIDLVADRCVQLEELAGIIGPVPGSHQRATIVEFHPLYSQRQEVVDHLRSLLTECGLAPEDFRDVEVAGVDQDRNAFAQLLRLKKGAP